MNRTIASLLLTTLSVGTTASMLLPQSASASEYHRDSRSPVIIVNQGQNDHYDRYDNYDHKDRDYRNDRNDHGYNNNYRHRRRHHQKVWVPGYYERNGWGHQTWVAGHWEYRR
jgi:hypothetical protein